MIGNVTAPRVVSPREATRAAPRWPSPPPPSQSSCPPRRHRSRASEARAPARRAAAGHLPSLGALPPGRLIQHPGGRIRCLRGRISVVAAPHLSLVVTRGIHDSGNSGTVFLLDGNGGTFPASGGRVVASVSSGCSLLEKGTSVPVTGWLSAGPCGRH